MGVVQENRTADAQENKMADAQENRTADAQENRTADAQENKMADAQENKMADKKQKHEMERKPTEMNLEKNAYAISRTNDMRKFIRTLAHVIFLSSQTVGNIYGSWLMASLVNHEVYAVRFLARYIAAYGTSWNLAFQTLFLTLAVAHDVMEWTDRTNTKMAMKLRYWRDAVFAGLVFPITMFVTCMFWGVYLVDRELVFPKIYDDVIPWWFNHCVHTNILVVIAAETVLQPRRRPVNWTLEHIFCAAISVAYAVVYYSIYFYTKRWLYPVFSIFTWWQVCLYQLLIWTSTYVFYRMQYPINRVFHGHEDVKESEDEADGGKVGHKKNSGDNCGKVSDNVDDSGKATELTNFYKLRDSQVEYRKGGSTPNETGPYKVKE